MAKKKDDGKPSTMQLVREAVEKLGMDAMPGDLYNEILQTHNVEVSKNIISTYKSMLKKQKMGKTKKTPRASTESSPKPESNDVVLNFIATVRSYESKLGATKLLQVIDALYNQG